MARIERARGVLDDFDRLFDHLAQFDVDGAPDRIADIVRAIQVLTHSPFIGWPAGSSRRELVIGRGGRGYVVLYRYIEGVDTVFVLAARSQREAGYGRDA